MVKIKETSKAGTIVNLNGVFGYIPYGKREFIPYTEAQLEKKTAHRDNSGWVEYESIEEYCTLRDEAYFAKKNEKKEFFKKMSMIEANPNNYTPIEIWQCALHLNRTLNNQMGADLVLADNPFSKRLLNVLGSYTVTPFDDGSLMIKANGKKYGNRRYWLSIEDIL